MEAATASGRCVSTAEEKFKAALNVIKSLPKNGPHKPSPHIMLKFYSYYKQATEGPCKKSKPWAWDVINRAKWEAWTKLEDMSKVTAMENYVENLKLIMTETPPPTDDQIVKAMPASDNVQGFIETLGSFYEVVELEPPAQFKKYSKLTSTPAKSCDSALVSGRTTAGHKMNGDGHESVSESEKGSKDPINDNGHTESAFKKSNQDDAHQLSDVEDIFCDTAEEIQITDVSLLHSYNILNTNEGAESTPRLDSGSTMDSMKQGESLQYQDRTESSASTMRTVDASGVGEVSPNRELGLSDIVQGTTGAAGEELRPRSSRSKVQDQITTTLLQLQQDMHIVLNRLTILEALVMREQPRRGPTTTGESATWCVGSGRQSKVVKSSWWPLSELSANTSLFIIVWPFVASWILSVSRRRRLPS